MKHRRLATLIAVIALVGTACSGPAPATPTAAPATAAPTPTAASTPTPTAGPTAAPPPSPNPAPGVSASPTPLVTSQTGRVVFARTIRLQVGEEDCTNLNAGPGTGEGCVTSWIVVANQDGTGERRLFPDGPPTQSVVAMSADGARLIVRGILPDDYMLYLTDAHGSEPQLLDTGCAAPCAYEDFFALSPDGSRLAFARQYDSDRSPAPSTVIAVMDMSTGAVVELGSTRVAGQFTEPQGDEGFDETPHWSPDGQRLLFTRSDIHIPNTPRTSVFETATFVVDVNGDNLRQLAPTELFARDAQWSPDGSLIVFTSAVEWITRRGSERVLNYANDIYTVRPDGAGVARLTTDSAAGVRDNGPRWTSDGRIVFTRTVPSTSMPYPLTEEVQVWVMDADGQHATRLDPTDFATLTAIGCVVCPVPFDPLVPLTMVYWVPAP